MNTEQSLSPPTSSSSGQQTTITMPVDPNTRDTLPGACELAPPSSVTVPIPRTSSGVDGRRRIHRVPPEMRLDKQKSQHLFDPVVVSLGPYHHGKPHLARAEKVKDEILSVFLSDSGQDKGFFYRPISQMLDEIRALYVGISKDDINDAEFAEMMLRDAVFTLYYMMHKFEYTIKDLGLSGLSFMFRDLLMAENQVPYVVVKLLVQLRFKENEGRAIICTHLSLSCFGDDTLTEFPWEEDGRQEPLHLLDAARMTYLWEKEDHDSRSHYFSKCRWPSKEETLDNFQRISNPFRSVNNLSEKGIHFMASNSNCLMDVKFSSYAYYGLLRLPKWFVSTNSKVFFSNILALEMCPESWTHEAVTSYIDFMKSLIETSEDVKKLREKGILFSNLGSDDEVVKLFKDIDTMGMGNSEIFENVKTKMHKHCSSRSKTWVADLIRTYFQSPWTAIALLAAAFLLFLTFFQTYLAFLSNICECKKSPK